MSEANLQKAMNESTKYVKRQEAYIELVNRLISEAGLHKVKVNMNGNCLFLALSFALTNTFPDFEFIGNTFLASFLRNDSITTTINTGEVQNMTAEDIFINPTSKQQAEFEKKSLDERIALYRTEMSKKGMWGGPHEISSLLYSSLVNSCIHLYSLSDNNTLEHSVLLDACNPAGKRQLRVFFTGAHYDVILTREEFTAYQQLTDTARTRIKESNPDIIISNCMRYLGELEFSKNLERIIELETLFNYSKIKLYTMQDENAYPDLLNSPISQLYNSVVDRVAARFQAPIPPVSGSLDPGGGSSGSAAAASSSAASTPAKTPAKTASSPSSAAAAASSAAASTAAASTPAKTASSPSSAAAAASSPSSAAAPPPASSPSSAAAAAPSSSQEEIERIVAELVTEDPASERLVPDEFLHKKPTSANLQTIANELYRGYNNRNFYAIQTSIQRIVSHEHSFSEIIPRLRRIGKNTLGGLIQSNCIFAKNPGALKDYKIKLIVQAAIEPEIRGGIQGAITTMPEGERPFLLELEMKDDLQQSVTTALTKSMEYPPGSGRRLELLDLIEAVREDGGSVVVNCALGISRSSAIIIMYLMRIDDEKNMSFLNAWRFLKFKRPIILPNYSFLTQLKRYEGEYRGQNTVSTELIRQHPDIVILSSGYSNQPAQDMKRCSVCAEKIPKGTAVCPLCGAKQSGGRRKTYRKVNSQRHSQRHSRRHSHKKIQNKKKTRKYQRL